MALLKNKTALVTGATRGIGFSIARHLLEKGANVICTGTGSGGKGPNGTELLVVNFKDDQQVETFCSQVDKIQPDILVNNAGINKISPFAEIAPKDFAAIQKVNVEAPFRLCRVVIPGMRENGWGRIVNIGSVWGKIGKELRASYSSSKHGLVGLTSALAAEVTKYGILANCVSPGIIETEMTRSILSEEQIQKLLVQVPAGRLGKPEEVAHIVAWLVGPENTFIAGQNIGVDGGLTRV
mgnify:CR=1 FL=1